MVYVVYEKWLILELNQDCMLGSPKFSFCFPDCYDRGAPPLSTISRTVTGLDFLNWDHLPDTEVEDYCTLTMSSFEDLHCTEAETSVTAPFISMETILTGMATVRPVRMAVLIISVSFREKRKVIFMKQWEAERFSLIFHQHYRCPHLKPLASGLLCLPGDSQWAEQNSFYWDAFHCISSSDISIS